MDTCYRLFTIALAPYADRVAREGGAGNNVRYMSPTTLIEYLSAGKALICSNLPALRELVKHEYNALLCDPGAVDQWSDALRRLQDDQGLRCRLANSARDSYLGRHTFDQRARSILSAL
jgi:glycosyltransferase involved in cell wall biosynthesis